MKHRAPPMRLSARHLAPAFLTLGSLAASGSAWAFDPLGLYVGATVGQAHMRTEVDGAVQVVPGQASAEALGALDHTQTGFQVLLGVRPVSFLGAEVSYIDLGSQSWPPAEQLAHGTLRSGQASQKGEAAFAMLYLPVPIIDVYVKAGVSRITTDLDANVYGASQNYFCQMGVPFCAPGTVHLHHTSTSFAAGAGVQWQIGDWALRGEYERFGAFGAHPALMSFGVTWSIP